MWGPTARSIMQSCTRPSQLSFAYNASVYMYIYILFRPDKELIFFSPAEELNVASLLQLTEQFYVTSLNIRVCMRVSGTH
jgi:hypothetical protein